jgi:hypothetical protein
MKQVIKYNIDCIKHLAFITNDEKKQAHWCVVYPDTGAMLLVTHRAFAIVVQFVQM